MAFHDANGSVGIVRRNRIDQVSMLAIGAGIRSRCVAIGRHHQWRARYHLIQYLCKYRVARHRCNDPVKIHRKFQAFTHLAVSIGMVFALHHDRVVIVAERRARDLEPAEVSHLIERVGVVADHYDDQLISRFGGTKVSDLP